MWPGRRKVMWQDMLRTFAWATESIDFPFTEVRKIVRGTSFGKKWEVCWGVRRSSFIYQLSFPVKIWSGVLVIQVWSPGKSSGWRCTCKASLFPAFQHPLQGSSTWLSQHHQSLGVRTHLPISSQASSTSSLHIIPQPFSQDPLGLPK